MEFCGILGWEGVGDALEEGDPFGLTMLEARLDGGHNPAEVPVLSIPTAPKLKVVTGFSVKLEEMFGGRITLGIEAWCRLTSGSSERSKAWECDTVGAMLNEFRGWFFEAPKLWLRSCQYMRIGEKHTNIKSLNFVKREKRSRDSPFLISTYRFASRGPCLLPWVFEFPALKEHSALWY